MVSYNVDVEYPLGTGLIIRGVTSEARRQSKCFRRKERDRDGQQPASLSTRCFLFRYLSPLRADEQMAVRPREQGSERAVMASLDQPDRRLLPLLAFGYTVRQPRRRPLAVSRSDGHDAPAEETLTMSLSKRSPMPDFTAPALDHASLTSLHRPRRSLRAFFVSDIVRSFPRLPTIAPERVVEPQKTRARARGPRPQ